MTTTASHPAFELSHSFAGVSRLLGRWLVSRPVPARHTAASIVSLAHHEIHAVTSFQGGSIECTEGCVWLTHDGDCRDVLLEAGQSHLADRGSRLVIYAMASSAVRLLPRAALSH
jgi:hypothetical protein